MNDQNNVEPTDLKDVSTRQAQKPLQSIYNVQ